MKNLFITLLMLSITLTAAAADLGNRAPRKPAGPSAPPPPPIPEVIRQGGDTVADAVPITVSTIDLAGTTTGYTDDYDHECPYGGSTSPDVVYSFVSEIDALLDVDMFGSEYDTKIWVWDETLDWPIACNDDYYPDYTSRIENMAVAAGGLYYIVVDGYGGEHGPYLIDVVPSDDCDVDCPADAALEGEPPLQADYVDLHNGGCNTDLTEPPMQELTAPVLCGKSGWYLDGDDTYRDTDWFTATIPAGGVLEITIMAEVGTRLAAIGPQDCDTVDLLYEVVGDNCDGATLAVVGEVGATAWLWVSPAGWFPSEIPFDAYEYDYVLMANLGSVTVEEQSWSGIRAIFE